MNKTYQELCDEVVLLREQLQSAQQQAADYRQTLEQMEAEEGQEIADLKEQLDAAQMTVLQATANALNSHNRCMELAAHVESAAGIMHRLVESPAHIDSDAPPAVRAYLDWYASKPADSLARPEGETVPKWKFDAVVKQCELVEKARDTERQRLRELNEGDPAEAWRWMGDGNDHHESLTCPVLISANALRRLIAEKQAEAVETFGMKLRGRAGDPAFLGEYGADCAVYSEAAGMAMDEAHELHRQAEAATSQPTTEEGKPA